jgi:hypothetical protein
MTSLTPFMASLHATNLVASLHRLDTITRWAELTVDTESTANLFYSSAFEDFAKLAEFMDTLAQEGKPTVRPLPAFEPAEFPDDLAVF